MDPRVRTTLRDALQRRAGVVVPAIVVTETYRGGGRAVPIDQLLGLATVPAAGLDLAKQAGLLLARTGGSNTADALVVAEAIRQAPCVILTGDPDDIGLLAAGLAGVAVIDINAL